MAIATDMTIGKKNDQKQRLGFAGELAETSQCELDRADDALRHGR